MLLVVVILYLAGKELYLNTVRILFLFFMSVATWSASTTRYVPTELPWGLFFMYCMSCGKTGLYGLELASQYLNSNTALTWETDRLKIQPWPESGFLSFLHLTVSKLVSNWQSLKTCCFIFLNQRQCVTLLWPYIKRKAIT